GRVGGPGGWWGLDRVVADRAERVERQLVAAVDAVQLRADAADERGELALVAASQRFEVQVDAVGAPVADRGCDLPGEIGPGRGRAEQRLLAVQTGGVQAEALDGQHHAAVVKG